MSSKTKNNYTIIGLMSGTSLDGLDIACCNFSLENEKWTFQIQQAETIKYSAEWEQHLKQIKNYSAYDFYKTHTEYGYLLGSLVKQFVQKYQIRPDFVASHGHTVFHRPDLGFTCQIGNGAAIAASCSLSVVCDFRSLDVALQGQGAPLVPIGDELLFAEFDACLNLGGFANVSYKADDKRIAYDICPFNTIFNDLANKLDYAYDKGGVLAASGKPISELLSVLNSLAYYHIKPPKSLGREWLEQYFYPALKEFENRDKKDIMHTCVLHFVEQIATALQQKKQVLITGGGAYHQFFISQLQQIYAGNIIIPDAKIIEYKEALIFAFLGLLRWLEQPNCLKSVTGAAYNNIGGAIYLI